jgi:hypothetical protein
LGGEPTLGGSASNDPSAPKAVIPASVNGPEVRPREIFDPR